MIIHDRHILEKSIVLEVLDRPLDDSDEINGNDYQIELIDFIDCLSKIPNGTIDLYDENFYFVRGDSDWYDIELNFEDLFITLEDNELIEALRIWLVQYGQHKMPTLPNRLNKVA